MRFPRLVPLLAATLLAATLLGCAPDDSAAQVVYRVTSLDGGPPSEQDMANGRSRLDVRLLEAGYDQRDVSPLGADTLRVVLPENVADKMPEIRALLEVQEDLPVRIEALPD